MTGYRFVQSSPQEADLSLVELGNPAAKFKPALADDYTYVPDPRVTYVYIPDEPYQLDARNVDVRDVALHLVRNPDVTNLPGLEPLLVIAHPTRGAWLEHSDRTPQWVRSSDPEMERLLAAFYGCEAGAPADLEETHWTRYGTQVYAPGHNPFRDPLFGVKALKTSAGNDIQALQMFNAGGVLGQTGTATATSATSLTGGTEAPGGSHASNDAVGLTIVAGSVYGYVTANTSGTTPVYTVDRWYVPGSPGGAAGTTPGSTATYTLIAGSLPAFFMGLTANAVAPGAGDTTLTGEITTGGGGLIRKICPTAHSAGVASSTLTPVFTANGSDSLPVTVAKIGVSQSLTSGVKQLFQTLLNVTATLSASGDQLTVTETISQ